MSSAPDYASELRCNALFGGMTEQHLETLLLDVQEVQLDAGQNLFRHGEPAARFFFVREGMIKLFRLSRDGNEKIIEIVRAGETFAEAVVFMGVAGRYPVSADAISGARVLAFNQKALFDLLRSAPDACFGILASMSRRLHMLVNQIDSLTLQNATYRLVAYLVEQIPADVKTSPEVQLTTPKGAIASRLAIQPETLSRILARLRQRGLIDVHGPHIAVRDVSALRELVRMPPDEED